MVKKKMHAEGAGLLGASAAHLEEEKSALIVPKTPEKSNRFKYIPNVVVTPFKLQKKRKKIHKDMLPIILAPFVETEEMKNDEEWFRKKRAGRKKKSLLLSSPEGTSLTIFSESHICTAKNFFMTHFIIKDTLHMSSKSIVYAVERKKLKDLYEEGNSKNICEECIEEEKKHAHLYYLPEKTQRVVKVMKKKYHTLEERLYRAKEAKFLYQLKWCRNVVQIISAWEEDSVLYIETELCNNGTLREYLLKKETVPVQEKMQIIMQMLYALRSIHKTRIIHLDLKPENIYLHKERDNNQLIVQIGDFGISRRIDDVTEIEFDGDRLYLAPELLQNTCSSASDVYSMGLILLEILFEVKMPLKSIQWTKVSVERKKEIIKRSEIPQKIYNLIKTMIHKDPAKRPCAEIVFKEMKSSLSSIFTCR